METIFRKKDIKVASVQIRNMDIRSCIACGHSFKTQNTYFDDVLNELAVKLKETTVLRYLMN